MMETLSSLRGHSATVQDQLSVTKVSMYLCKQVNLDIEWCFSVK